MSQKSNIWHTLNAKQSLEKLKSSEKGLSAKEVKARLEKQGLNILATKKKFSVPRLILSQFKNALVYVLVVAGVISFLFEEFVDAYVIFAAVLINVVVGFIQEYKANQSLDKLNKVVKKESLVFRDGIEQKIEAKFLVPGDVIVLQSGDRVPADARLLSTNDLKVNEASLTGESWPVKKDLKKLKVGTVLAERVNMVFTGTLVVEGRATAVVTDTGFETEMGKITVLLKDTEEEKTPLQEKLDHFARGITILVLLIAALLFGLGVYQGKEWVEMFTVAVAVAVAAIPEGLVISMTMILTVGMQRILKENGLVRRLVSAETLGSTTVICTDKTGTLTEGEMRVTRFITAGHQFDLAAESLKDIDFDDEAERLMEIAFYSNDSAVQNPDEPIKEWSVIGSPTEKALLLFGAYLKNDDLDKKYQRVAEIPFDSDRKFMITRHNFSNTQDILFIKGAPEKVLDFSDKYFDKGKEKKLSNSKHKYFDEAWKYFSKQGLRVLAGGYQLVPKKFGDLEKYKDQPKDFVFVGIWGLSDPLRPETKETLQQTFAAGINTVIITGDNKFTAKSIAKELGLDVSDDSVVTGDELLKLSDEELEKRIKSIKVYARVTPADKLRIIKAWQKKGQVVSMTGDGVNDAPALKAANVGVAVSSGSDVAKETADLVLLDNNFSTIVMAVKQGRVIFANIKKVILYLLSDSFSQVIIVVTSLFLGTPLPILPAQILWINLVTDGLPALSLTMEPEEKDIMKKRPKVSDGLLDFESKFLIGAISFIIGLTAFSVFWYFWKTTGNLDLARTVTFTVVGLETLVYVFSVKSLDYNVFQSNPFNNKYLNGAVLLGLVLQFAAVYLPFFNKYLKTVPLGWKEWQIMLLATAFVLVFVEVVKFIFILHKRKKSAG